MRTIMRIPYLTGTVLLCLFCTNLIFAQQLKLGKNPYTVQKSAVLELNSDNQGLLLVRISDTSLINSLSPPDGMVIFFIPTSQLYVRSGGSWKSLAFSNTLATTYWSVSGNVTGAVKKLGATDNFGLSVITNNIERIRVDAAGYVGIGSSTFDGTNPEKLLVDAGVTTSFNAAAFKGSINNYLQLNIQNNSTGTAASSDLVATSDNGNESVNFVDLGINSSNYNSTGILGGANNAYLYSTGNDFLIGNSVANKNLTFFTGGTAVSNERMRITGTGRVGIGVTNPTNPLVVKDTFEVRRTGTMSQILFSNTAGAGDFRIAGDGGDIFWQGGGGRNLQMGSYWGITLAGDRQSATIPGFVNGVANTGVLVQSQRDASVPLAIQGYSASQSANLTEWRNSAGTILNVIDETGSMAIGASTFDASNPEKLLVDAGNTLSYNVISGKGTINNYLQLNIQNKSNGTTASSDLVATADNGTESVNYVDLGINSSGFTNVSSPILGGINNAYLYSTGNDFVIGNGTASKNLRFFTGGFANTNERLRIDATGYVGINTTAPSTLLHVKTGTSGDSGFRMENLTSSSSVTAGAAVIGVDATGKVVRTKTPTYYSGTGASATTEDVTKVWVAEVTNTGTGIQTINIPTNVAFTTILNIQLTAKGGSSVTTAPIALITSNTTSAIVIRVLESKLTSIVLGGNAEGLEAHTDTGTKIYVRVEGN
jgi:hypothetical protein